MSLIIDGFLFWIGVALFCITLAVAPTLITVVYYLLEGDYQRTFSLTTEGNLSPSLWVRC